jgi:diphthamide synthase (EF-2-diphthine--ammonia ligase)
MPAREKITADEIGCSALSWSGGKDSALTLWTLREQGVEPAALITTVTDQYDRISMHGVRRELLARQVVEREGFVFCDLLPA